MRYRNHWTEFGPTSQSRGDNIPGAQVYEGYGTGRCNCSFTKTYPYAVGPRLGVAYQINEKTVFRGGGGLSYAPVQSFSYITNAAITGVGFNQLTFVAPAFGVPTSTLSQGLQYNPALLTAASLTRESSRRTRMCSGAPIFTSIPMQPRPPRIFSWSMGYSAR